jgi:hypothetical protein
MKNISIGSADLNVHRYAQISWKEKYLKQALYNRTIRIASCILEEALCELKNIKIENSSIKDDCILVNTNGKEVCINIVF